MPITATDQLNKKDIDYCDNMGGSQPTTGATVYTPKSPKSIRLARNGKTGGLWNDGLRGGVSEYGGIAVRVRHTIDAARHEHVVIYRSPVEDRDWQGKVPRVPVDYRGSYSRMHELAQELMAQGCASVLVVRGIRDFHNSRTIVDRSW